VNSLHRIVQVVEYCYNDRVLVTMTGYPLQCMPSVDVQSHRYILGNEIQCQVMRKRNEYDVRCVPGVAKNNQRVAHPSMALPLMYTRLYRYSRRELSEVLVANAAGDPHLRAMARKCCMVVKVLHFSSSTVTLELVGVVIPHVNDVFRVAV
jgi:hypothetical protein